MKKVVYEVRKEMALTDERPNTGKIKTEGEVSPKDDSLREILLAPHIADFKTYSQTLIKLDL